MRKQLASLILLAAILLAIYSTPNRVAATAGQFSPAALQLDPFLSGLSSPIFIGNAGDGTNRLFIIEQGGIIKVVHPGSTATTDFLNITPKVLSGGERGLLGLAFHPQFETNRRFFVDYTRQTDGATVIAEYHASAANPDVADVAETILLVIPQPFSNHNGGMLAFGPDGFLYIAMGDGGSANDPGNRAQNINDLLGKILRINVDIPNGSIPYSSPPTNPFFGATPGADEIYAVGMRNPWRFSFDRQTGQLYVGDVGQGAREEVDIVTLGGNYGWRVFEGNQCTGLGPAPCDPSNYIFPITEYAHAGGRCSITGGYVYRGTQATFNPGTYLFADFCTGEIFKFEGGAQSLLLDTAINISSFGEDEAGELYVVGLGGTVHKFTNTQPACSFTIDPLSQSFGAGGGTGGVAVTTQAGCNWSAMSNAPWIMITGGSSGTGSGMVSYSVAVNTVTTPRMGTITIAGQTFTVNQAAASCSFMISPTEAAYESSGGTGSVMVSAGAGCNWTAMSNAAWISITSGASGSGNGTVNYAVARNASSSPRSSSITIAGQMFIITQAGASCITGITPQSRSVGSIGASATVTVTAPLNCNWAAQSLASWISITSGGNGPGSKTLKYAYATNTSTSPRTGVIQIGSLQHTVTQAGATGGGCSFSINPTSQSFASTGGSGMVNVTTAQGCSWMAVSNAGFITITGGSSGTGSGVVSFSVATNTSSSPRSGTMTIAGQTFTVNQAGATGGCSFSINPTSQNFAAGGGNGTVNVTTTASCSWMAVSNAGFIMITGGGSGTGSGVVSFSVAANTSSTPRSGTLTIAGQTFTVNQAGAASACSFTLNPVSKVFGRSGGSSTVSVTTSPGCAWTAVSNAPWITITGGASGSGSGVMSYTVSATTTTRTGTITIAGKTFTIKQSAF